MLFERVGARLLSGAAIGVKAPTSAARARTYHVVPPTRNGVQLSSGCRDASSDLWKACQLREYTVPPPPLGALHDEVIRERRRGEVPAHGRPRARGAAAHVVRVEGALRHVGGALADGHGVLRYALQDAPLRREPPDVRDHGRVVGTGGCPVPTRPERRTNPTHPGIGVQLAHGTHGGTHALGPKRPRAYRSRPAQGWR